MPFYIYNCKECDSSFKVWHGMTETQKECVLCEKEGGLVRVPQIPSVVRATIEDEKIGRLTEECIGENQQLLSEMKKEARNQIYED